MTMEEELDYAGGLRKFFEISELSAQHSEDQKRQVADQQEAKRRLENEATDRLHDYLSLDSVEELRAVVEKLHRKSTTLEFQLLDRAHEEQRTALKREHAKIEQQMWDQAVEADIPVGTLPPKVIPPATAPRSSVLAKPTPAPVPSSTYSASMVPSAHKQGPLVAPAVSGEMRGYRMSPDPIRHGALPIISHVPSQGPLGYPSASQQPQLQQQQQQQQQQQKQQQQQQQQQQRHREAPPPGSRLSSHGSVVAYQQSAPVRSYQNQHPHQYQHQPMSQARVDIAPRPNQYGNHVTPTQIQQPTSNGRHPLPQERYGGSQDPRASAPPPTQWVSGGQSAQQAHSRPPVAYASGPPSLAGSIAVMNVINANRDKMASHSSASPSGRDLAPIMATSSARPVQHDSIPAKRKVPNGDDGANGLSAKRSRYDIASGTDGRRSVSSSTTKPTDRTISFDEVYRDGAPEYKHIIIQFPDGGDFYILRCDEHGVHFGEHPLRGAAKHLASAQHGRMSKEHTKAVETLGCIVLGCTPELMEKNNTMVKKSFEDGYKPFNANQLSKTARAMKGYPQLDKQGLPIPDSAQRPTKKFSGVAKAKPGELYVALHPDDQKSYPVLILPWTDGNLSAVGMEMTLEEAGLFHLTLPRCFDYIHGVETVQGIKGWAAGYQDGGVYMKQREFPCVYIVDKDTKHWTFGWIEAKNLSPFDFSDAKRADLPGFDAAREYYATNVNKFESWKDMEAHRQATAAQQPTAADLIGPSPVVRAGRQPLPNSRPVKDKDVEMTGVAHPDDSDQESDQDSSGNSTTNSDNDVEMANVDSRRTSVSNRDDSSSTAKLIAAQAVQALSLQNSTPATSSVPARAPDNVPKPGFVAVNSPGFVAVNSRSAASSPGPSSRPPVAGQGSGTHQGFERRRVEKIHASSKRVSQQATAAAATTTPSSPAVQAATLPAQTTQASPDVAVRKPSPASLQHILHDSDAPEEARTKSTTGPRQPTISPQPLSSIVVKTNVQGVLARPDRAESVPVRQSESGEKDADQPRSSSLTPIPLATPSTPAFTSNSTGRLQLPSVQPLPSQQRYPTPLSSATESAAGKTQLPALAFPRPNEMSPAQSEVVTPTVSVINSRSNSPVVASVAAPIKSEFNPEADVFAVVKVQEDGADLFVSTPQVQQLFIEDDHRSGVIKAAGSTPENVRSFTLDPKLMKSATRTQGQTMDTTVQILMNDGKTFTLVFETAKLDAFRSENGRVQARRFCRRLMAWNRSVECPSVVEGEGKPQL